MGAPFRAACPSLTAGPAGMRAELFAPNKLLQPRERQEKSQALASIRGKEGKCED